MIGTPVFAPSLEFEEDRDNVSACDHLAAV